MLAQQLWSLIKTPECRLKEYFHRRPDPHFNWGFCSGEMAAKADESCQRLNEDGIVMFPGYFTGGMLKELQEAFDKSVDGQWCKQNPNSLHSDDFLTQNPVFLRAALDPLLLEVSAATTRKNSPSAVPAPNGCSRLKRAATVPINGIMTPVAGSCT